MEDFMYIVNNKYCIKPDMYASPEGTQRCYKNKRSRE